MDFKELNYCISTNTLPDDGMVWRLQDSSAEFIANQYIKSIANAKGLTIKLIESFNEIGSAGFIEDTNLYIYKTTKLTDFSLHDNCIIICTDTKYQDAINIPTLESWQFVDYLQAKVPGMNKADIEWLVQLYTTTYDRKKQINFFRLDNDLDKIAIFPESVQASIFDQLYKDGEYDNISNLTLFDMSDALLKNNPKLALEVLKVYDYIDSKPDLLLVSILLGNFKKVINIQLNPNATPESVGMSDKQFYAIKKFNTGVYSNDKLRKIYELLTSVEYKFKFTGLDANQIADYIICKILGD